SAEGIDLSRRLGLASALAAPRHTSIVASRSPSYAPIRRFSAVMSPRIWIPAAQWGRSRPGRCTSTVVPIAPPNNTRKATRRITIATARYRYKRKAFAHGASALRDTTTWQTTTMINARSHGLVVRLAATAMHSAHSHQAKGCRSRGRKYEEPLPFTGTSRRHLCGRRDPQAGLRRHSARSEERRVGRERGRRRGTAGERT